MLMVLLVFLIICFCIRYSILTAWDFFLVDSFIHIEAAARIHRLSTMFGTSISDVFILYGVYDFVFGYTDFFYFSRVSISFSIAFVRLYFVLLLFRSVTFAVIFHCAQMRWHGTISARSIRTQKPVKKEQQKHIHSWYSQHTYNEIVFLLFLLFPSCWRCCPPFVVVIAVIAMISSTVSLQHIFTLRTNEIDAQFTIHAYIFDSLFVRKRCAAYTQTHIHTSTRNKWGKTPNRDTRDTETDNSNENNNNNNELNRWETSWDETEHKPNAKNLTQTAKVVCDAIAGAVVVLQLKRISHEYFARII